MSQIVSYYIYIYNYFFLIKFKYLNLNFFPDMKHTLLIMN